MVTVADRGAPELAAAVIVTVPFPVPLPGVTVNDESLLTAVHAQSLVVVTVTVTVPPAFGTEAEVGDTAKAQTLLIRNDSPAEKALVTVPSVARARQKNVPPGFRSRSIIQLVVPLP